MKKVLLVGALAFGLAGCGSDVNEESLTSLKEQNAQQQVQIEELENQVNALQEQLKELAITPQAEEPTEQPIASFTLKTLDSDGNSYTRTEVKVQPKQDENHYEAMLRTIFPELTFNYVEIDTDSTITIDVNENSTGAPNMTSSAQVAMFLDRLTYALTENFPELKGYYLTSNGEVTYMGDSGPYEGLNPLAPLMEEEMYLPING